MSPVLRMFVVVALSGCSLGEQQPLGIAAAPCDTGAAALSVALGETVDDAFVSIGSDAEPMLVFGPQGGHHLELALTVDGLGPAPAEPLLSLAAEQEGASVGGWQRILDDPRPAGTDGPATWLDLRLVVQAWSEATERRLTAAVGDERCGTEGTAEVLLDADPTR